MSQPTEEFIAFEHRDGHVGFGGHRGAPASSVKQRHLAEKVIDAERNVPGGLDILAGSSRIRARPRELRLRTVRS